MDVIEKLTERVEGAIDRAEGKKFEEAQIHALVAIALAILAVARAIQSRN